MSVICKLLNSLLSYFSLQILWGYCPSIHADMSFCDRYLSMKKLPSNLVRKSLRFTIKLQIHITQNTLHAFTGTFSCATKRKYQYTRCIGLQASRTCATNISNWFTRESCDKSVCYNYFYCFCSSLKDCLSYAMSAYLLKKYRFSLIKYLPHLFLTCNNNNVIFYINYIYDKK